MKKMSVISVIVNRNFAFVKEPPDQFQSGNGKNEVHRGVWALIADYGCGR